MYVASLQAAIWPYPVKGRYMLSKFCCSPSHRLDRLLWQHLWTQARSKQHLRQQPLSWCLCNRSAGQVVCSKPATGSAWGAEKGRDKWGHCKAWVRLVAAGAWPSCCSIDPNLDRKGNRAGQAHPYKGSSLLKIKREQRESSCVMPGGLEK